ncbi:beta-hydroxyacyl-ACP dehydratase [Rummeliibacillus suwonensis]|uniref:beta-hydroxyacyl-ACP dehydratase n=1 Tax=Rummeliibacillus suwonensis TaxID=1306154 RepID=UPI001AAE272B|nr:beta-hydroxyacyl-ACP dehydratase [Rummeliibacillus suwonensis]MBO2535956.1 beta-hydroxyacyl-ACP dehydratase [Rummeliibacillus suwonensis]
MKENQRLIPHMYPMYFVDGIIEKIPFKKVKGFKNITWNEWFINQNIEKPHMPELLIVEAIGQISAYVLEEKEKKLGVIAEFSGVNIFDQAFPGDRLELFFEVTKRNEKIFRGWGTASVDGRVIVEVKKFTILYVDYK